MTQDEAVVALDAICYENSGDAEGAHLAADETLLKFLDENGFKEIADAWRRADERYDGFWYA